MDFSSLSDQSSHAAFSLCTTSTSFTCSRVAVCACCMWWRWRRIYGEVITCFPPALIHLKFFRFMDSFFRRVTLLSLSCDSQLRTYFLTCFSRLDMATGRATRVVWHTFNFSHTPQTLSNILKFNESRWQWQIGAVKQWERRGRGKKSETKVHTLIKISTSYLNIYRRWVNH